MALATATTKTFPSSGHIFIITATFRTTTWVINELIGGSPFRVQLKTICTGSTYAYDMMGDIISPAVITV